MRATLLLSAVCLLLLPMAVRAETPDEGATPEDIRFDLFKADGEVYRFDRKTGEILKIVKTKEGFVAVPQPVRIVGKPPALPFSDSGPLRLPQITRERNQGDMAQFDDTQKKKPAASIEWFDAQGNDITYQITDPEREAAQPAILSYTEKMSLVQSFQMGERISGSILVRNKGDKKIKVLELTLQISVVGQDKPAEHRYLFVDKPGQAGPPQPATLGRDGNLLVQKVDQPCPAGRILGAPIVKISYIKFAE